MKTKKLSVNTICVRVDIPQKMVSEIDIPMEVIGRALGHAMWDNAVTSTYIKYDTKKIDEANRKVIDYLNKDLKDTDL
jgi:hypothetical protein